MAEKYDKWFTARFNTKLSDDNEQRFNNWLATQSKQRSRDLKNDIIDYDLRGYWVNGGHKDTGDGHMTDKWKKPNHPTFSTESSYSGTKDERGFQWDGGTWEDDYKKFTPSKTMRISHPDSAYNDYFKKYEPGVTLMPFNDK